MRAELVAREAMEKELAAHVTVDAALKRRAERHKDLVRELEAKGWDLRIADKLTQVSLKGDCNQLASFLRSAPYHRARQECLQLCWQKHRSRLTEATMLLGIRFYFRNCTAKIPRD